MHESKASKATIILDVTDIYIGFSLWGILAGDYNIHSLIIKDGFFDLVMHPDGTTNIENALASPTEIADGPPLNIRLQKIVLRNLDIYQHEEATNMDIGTLIYWAKGGFNMDNDQIEAHVESEFELNRLKNSDTTYFKNKHFELNTDLVYNRKNGLLVFGPSGIPR